MKICIPSKGRSTRITTKNFFNCSDIYLFVEPEEFLDYQSNNTDCKIISINKNNLGIGYARNFIVEYMQTNYPNDETILIIDDDITIMYDETTKNKMQISEIEDMLKILGEKVVVEDLGLCGLYLKNMVRMKNKSKRNYNDKTHGLNIVNIKKLKTLNINYCMKLRIYEDIDLLIQLLKKECSYVVCSLYSFDNYSFKERTLGKGVGGCSLDWQTRKTEDATLVLLSRRGSEIIKPKVDKQGFCNFTVNWKALKSFTRINKPG